MRVGNDASIVLNDETLRDVSGVAGLFDEGDLHGLGAAALEAKRARFGDKVFWTRSVHVNYTNVCEGTCRFCRYRRVAGDSDAFVLTIDQVVAAVEEEVGLGVREIHLVGGVNSSLAADYPVVVVGRLRECFPDLYIKAFTAVEIDFFARRLGWSVERMLGALRDGGLNCLAGGGAEIFAERVRSELYPEKIDADRWCEIHRIAHGVGLVSNATMLFGHIETSRERAEHLLRLRALQEETGGFQAFLPLPVIGFSGREISGIDALKTLAISRLVLDNVAHIKVFRPIWTVKLAQLGLSYGADDFDGTVGRYAIAGGAGRDVDVESIGRWIEQSGVRPVERRGDYSEVR